MLRGWRYIEPTHPGWCRTVEAHNREECSPVVTYINQRCWLELNGWGSALYMDDGREQATECAKLRGNDSCKRHEEVHA